MLPVEEIEGVVPLECRNAHSLDLNPQCALQRFGGHLYGSDLRVDRTESGVDQRADGDGPVRRRTQAISVWLASGVDPAECARRAGQSIQVLFRYYAKFLAEARNHANNLIEESMRRWERPKGGVWDT
ncbi:hypothetical protein OHA88_06330 [Streptomyces sp. NBC_00353]|uniref:hypothetical protein n=1 Tax=Streptomyces sp. NBC_00353 TaxID=2975722 RepID=UPI002E26403D